MDRVLQIFRYEGNKNCEVRAREMLIDVMGMVTNFTYMRKSGVPESVIMKITGHSTREMFLRYDTVDDGDTRKAVDQFE
jgi:hypothetical protein